MKKGNQDTSRPNGFGRRRFMTLAAMGAGMAALPPLGKRAFGQAPAEILIGGTISKSGPFQGITSPFEDLANAWAKRINARGGIPLSKLGRALPVRFVFYDDQSDPSTALRFYERLATVDEVNAFIGPFSSFITNASMQAASTNNIPFFMAEASDSVLLEEKHPWVTALTAPARIEHDKVVELYRRVGGVKRWALLARDNLHEKAAMEGFARMLREAGFEVVFQEVAPKEMKDFSSIVLKMKQAQPDAIFAEALPPPWNIGFLKQARSLGLNPKDIVLGHAPVPVIKSMGQSAENMVSVLWSYSGDTPDHKEFEAICNEAGIEAWQFSEAGTRYMSFRRIQDTLLRAGSLEPEAIRDAMWNTNLDLFGGEVTISHDDLGWGTVTQFPHQVQNGRYVSLWPIEAGERRFQHKNGRW